MIHNFLEVPEIMGYQNTICFITSSQHFHPLSLFKDKHLEKLNFPTLFCGQFLTIFTRFFISTNNLMGNLRIFQLIISIFFETLLMFPYKKS